MGNDDDVAGGDSVDVHELADLTCEQLAFGIASSGQACAQGARGGDMCGITLTEQGVCQLDELGGACRIERGPCCRQEVCPCPESGLDARLGCQALNLLGDVALCLKRRVAFKASHKRDACVRACLANQRERGALKVPAAVDHEVRPAGLGRACGQFAHGASGLYQSMRLGEREVGLGCLQELELGRRELGVCRCRHALRACVLECIQPGAYAHDTGEAAYHAGRAQRARRPISLLKCLLYQKAAM